MTGMCSEKCIFRWFHLRANFLGCTYTNLYGIADYIPTLYGMDYCSVGENIIFSLPFCVPGGNIPIIKDRLTRGKQTKVW